MSSNIKELSTEELLNAIGSSEDDVPKIDHEHKNLVEFIQEYKIVEGNTRVPNYIIYWEYCRHWRPQGNKLSKIEFFRKFNKYFKTKRMTKKRCYLLKKGIFNIDKDNDEKAKSFDRGYTKRIKEKSKIKKEISSIKS